jgi:hypothetical protein
MQLFTPVSEDEARALVEGRPLSGPRWWVDRVVADEAGPDAVWVQAEVVDAEVAAFETTPDLDIGHREFEVPAEFAAGLTVVVVDR